MFTPANIKSITFAAIVSVLCSLILAGTASALKEKQEANVVLDMKTNILKSLNISDHKITADEKDNYYASIQASTVEKLYKERIEEQVYDLKGNLQEGMKPSEIKDGDKEHLAVFCKKENGQTVAYAIPISGKGLWSTIYGYFALQPDLNTVAGITFYAHGETPGLGARITESWFQNNFVGKKILDQSGKVVSVRIKKGKVRPEEQNASHMVDGISGATLTGRGVTHFLKDNLETYKDLFAKLRGNNNG